jgi:hypothetical protein
MKMEYPIDNEVFAELQRKRGEMIQKNPSADQVGIASPFVPWIGTDILNGAPGIYFVGKATRGPCEGDSFDRECCLKFSKEIATEPPARGLFWRYIKAVSKGVFGQEYAKCVSKIAWSNQYKIGVFDPSPGKQNTSLNPTGFYAATQIPLCKSILEREFQIADVCATVFLGDGPIMYPVVGKKGWDKKQYRNPDIDIKYRENGAPIIFHDHPESWRWKEQNENFQAHAEVVEFEIRKYLTGLRK